MRPTRLLKNLSWSDIVNFINGESPGYENHGIARREAWKTGMYITVHPQANTRYNIRPTGKSVYEWYIIYYSHSNVDGAERLRSWLPTREDVEAKDWMIMNEYGYLDHRVEVIYELLDHIHAAVIGKPLGKVPIKDIVKSMTRNLTGATGERGVDGAGIEFIFKRTPDATPIAAPKTNASQKMINDFVPDGWTSQPVDLTESLPYEWTCRRKGTANNWGEFSTPGIFTRLWPEDTDDPSVTTDPSLLYTPNMPNKQFFKLSDEQKQVAYADWDRRKAEDPSYCDNNDPSGPLGEKAEPGVSYEDSPYAMAAEGNVEKAKEGIRKLGITGDEMETILEVAHKNAAKTTRTDSPA